MVPPNLLGPPHMCAVCVNFKDRGDHDDDGDDGDDDDYDDLKGARTCIVSLGSEVSSGDLFSIFLSVTSAPCLQFISSPCC